MIESFLKFLNNKEKQDIIKSIKDNNLIYCDDIVDLIILKIERYLNEFIISKEVYINTMDNIKSTTGIEVYSRLNWLHQMKLDNMYGLHNNHDLVFFIFDSLNNMFNNENIDYYYTSGILSYTLVNKPLERYHHDIDVFVDYNQLDKLENICEKYGLTFKRLLGDREDGNKRRVMRLYYKDIDFPITVFMFVRNKDGSIIQKDYYYENDILMVEDLYNSPIVSKLSFDDNYHYHNDIGYKSISLEALFLCKNGHRLKDIYDCKKFEDYVDKGKLKKLYEEMNKTYRTESYEVTDKEIINFVNGKKVVKKYDRL